MLLRRSLSSFFLLLLLINILAPAFLFLPVKKVFNNYFKIAKSEGKLQKLYLSKSEYLRFKIKGENELKIDGHYYDIASESIDSDLYTLLVYHDIRESSFFESMAHVVGEKGEGNQKSQLVLLKVFDCYIQPTACSFTYFNEIVTSFTAFFSYPFCDTPVVNFSPPPELA